jgi:hypothetical protein
VAEDVLDLAWLQQLVDDHRDGAACEHAEEGRGGIRAATQLDRDPVSRLDACGDQPGGDLPGTGRQLAVARLDVAVDHRGVVGTPAGRGYQHPGGVRVRALGCCVFAWKNERVFAHPLTSRPLFYRLRSARVALLEAGGVSGGARV